MILKFGEIMASFEYTVPCLFGLEAILKREITDLGYEISSVDDGRVSFYGDECAIARANLLLRTGERVLLNIRKFEATSFEELFEETKTIPWEYYIPKDGKFWVTKASSIKSVLFSPSDIQSIVKKAIVERLKEVHKITWFEENGESYPIRVFLKKDQVEITLDTSGEGLHKRGYRANASKAPIRETLAAGIVQLSVWNKNRILVDPFCGSGTILIEAAMIGANIAPGRNRQFVSQQWDNLISENIWKDAFREATDVETKPELRIQGYDKDYHVLRIARENAEIAGVDGYIHFQDRDVADFSNPKQYGVIIANPPYGERLEELDDVIELYKLMGKTFEPYGSWSKYIITSYEEFENAYGKNATKKRKLYSGMLKTNLYQYVGPRPPRLNG